MSLLIAIPDWTVYWGHMHLHLICFPALLWWASLWVWQHQSFLPSFRRKHKTLQVKDRRWPWHYHLLHHCLLVHLWFWCWTQRAAVRLSELCGLFLEALKDQLDDLPSRETGTIGSVWNAKPPLNTQSYTILSSVGLEICSKKLVLYWVKKNCMRHKCVLNLYLIVFTDIGLMNHI